MLQADKHSLVFNSWHTGVGFSLARWVLTMEVALLIPLRGTAGVGVDAEEDGWSLCVEQCCSFRSVALSHLRCSLKAIQKFAFLVVKESRLSDCCRCSPPRRGLVLVAAVAPFCMSLVGV